MSDMETTKAPPVYEFPVEEVKIREFANATLSSNPIYRDVNLARTLGLPGVPVPPTFFLSSVIFRPTPETGPTSAVGGFRTLYGAQEFEFKNPVYSGDVLTVRRGKVTTEVKDGRRGGQMTLVVTETLFEKNGEIAVIARDTMIHTGVDVGSIALIGGN